MSISEREQETLESIREGLARSAPKLASMLAIFSRLTADEQMPVREPVRRAVRGLGTSATVAAGLMGAGRARLGLAGRWLWLVVTVALLVMALTLSHAIRSSPCPVSRAPVCGSAPAHAHPGVHRFG